MTITILTDLRRTFGALERDIEKAAAATLNATLFDARRGIIREAKRTFDRPRDWSTDKAFLFEKAKAADGAGMTAKLWAKPAQARVLKFQIDGGVRKKGDVGATPYDVAVGASPENIDQFGGIARGAMKRLGKALKKERTARTALAPRRSVVRALRDAAPTEIARQRVAKRLKPVQCVTKSKNEPGMFAATIGGTRGIWQRPERTLAAGSRQKGVKTVLPRGDNRPRLLLAFSDRARYTKKLRYQETMIRSQVRHLNTAAFGRELERIQQSRSTP